MDTKEYFSTRRTIRHFRDQEVSDRLIMSMLEEAAHAPTCGNMQLYSVIFTQDETLRHQLAECHFNQPAATGAPVLLTFCADFNRFVKWCEARGARPGFDNFQSWMSAVLDTSMLAQQFCTIAELHGLGTCILGTTTYTTPRISEILHLPQRVVPVTTVALGWPDDDGVDAGRLPIEAWVHDEVYEDYTPEKIDALYAQKEAREDSRQFCAENGKDSLAAVFTDVRYPKAVNEEFSKVYFDFVEKAGFKA